MTNRTIAAEMRRPFMVLGAVGMSLLLQAQPICSIDLGVDRTICEGQTTTLQAPLGFNTYLWSTGANSPSITVGSSGVYTCEVSYPTANLITNGNFSGGNTGFATDFNYSTTLTTDGNYYIGTNAASYHPQFSGTGTGNFMIVNSGWPSALFLVWCQDVVLCPGQTYTLSYRARTLSNSIPARLQWWIDGVPYGPEENLPAQSAGWQTITFNWTSGAAQTGATICLRAMSGDGVGNDFGLDDLDMRSTVVLTDEVLVNVTPLPVVDLGPDATLCVGQSLVLDVGVPGGTYLWQDGTTLSSFVIDGPGDYSVDVTANNCTASDAINVVYEPLPVVDLGPDLTLCTGETVVLDVGQPGAQYGWQDGSTGPTFTVTGPGVYSVNVLLGNCWANDAVDIAYNTTPVVALGPDITLCAGQQSVLDATQPGASYLWSDGSTDPTLTVTAAGTYSVAVTTNNCTGSDAINVAVTPLPVVSLGPDQTVCPGTSVTLNATTLGGSYLWHDGSSGPTFTSDQPGSYSVAVTVNNCTSSDGVDVAHFTLPVVDLGPDRTICAGATTTFSVAVPGASYLWSNGTNGNSLTTASAGIYWVDVTTNGCTVRDSASVAVTPLPAPDLGPDLSVCPGTTVVLDPGIAGAAYAWSTGATTQTISAGPGAYSVDVTLNGCSASDAIVIGTYPGATVDIGNDVTLCPGDQLVLNAQQAGASYVWQDGSTASTYTVTTAGNYNVQLTDANGCLANDAITVQYANPTAVALGPDVTLCQGDQITLDATVPGATYLWNTGATSATLTTSSAGNYSVVVTQGNCTVSDAVQVSVVTAPAVDLGPDVTLCPGETLTLNAAQAGATYAWSTGDQSASITVDQAGIYTVTVTNAANCATTDAMEVFLASPDAVELGTDITLCQGEQVVLDAALPGAAYLWSTGAATAAITVNSTGTYWVEVTQGSCSVSDTVDIVVQPAPVVSLGSDQTLCAGESTVLDATWPGATYLWSTGEQTASITVNTTGTYEVTVDLDGCIATDAITISVLTPGAVDLGPDQTVCAGTNIQLDATTPGATYLWNTGAQTPTLVITATGTYWVDVLQGNCSVSDTVEIIVQPVPTANLGSDQTLCVGESAVLDATWPGATYLWSTGEQTPSITVNTTGTYDVLVDLDGCSATDAIVITVLTPDALDLGPDQTVCADANTVLDATTPGSSYLWSTGAQTPTLAISATGTYWVEVLQGSCEVSDTIQITVIEPGTIDLGPDITQCEGTTVVLDATLAGASYVWNDGSTGATLTATTNGTYSVTATVQGCDVQDAVVLTFQPIPVVDLGGDRNICPGSIALLDATTPNATYLWHDGSTAATYNASTAGAASVTVTVNGCSAADAVQVSVLDGPTADLGPDVTICDGDAVELDVTQAGATYLWDDGSMGGMRTVSTGGTYTVTVELNGCTATDAVVITQVVLAGISLGPDLRLCPGNTVTLTAQAPGATTTWSTGATGPTLVVGAAGSYTAVVSIGSCSTSDTIEVTYVPLTPPDLGPDRTACEGELIELSVIPGNALATWSNGSTGTTLTASSSGTYTVEFSLEGCTTSDAVTLTFLPTSPEVDLGPDALLCPGETITLDASVAGGTYLWSNGSSAPITYASTPGTYSVEISTACGDTVASVTFTDGDCGPVVHAPNAFTPNADGMNDVFLVVVDGAVLNYALDIFDRWGERIFSSITPGEAWDGLVSGTEAQDGVYVYKVRYRALTGRGVDAQEHVGHVTLLR